MIVVRKNSHLNIAVVRRSAGANVVRRLAYQGSYNARYIGDSYDYAAEADVHVGQVVLAPPGASQRLVAGPMLDEQRNLVAPGGFQTAVLKSEKRRDSQEVRTADIAIPRAVPSRLELLVAAWALLPLTKLVGRVLETWEIF